MFLRHGGCKKNDSTCQSKIGWKRKEHHTYDEHGRKELGGYGLLTTKAHFHQLRPIPCKDLAPNQISQCKSTTVGQTAILYSGIYLVALGTGGTKAALPALGADQFDAKNAKRQLNYQAFSTGSCYSD
ncbi:hypothetical protein Lal_00004571 [Lupinus albus]|nr:hypothetical protein Lal_00004571 [Lupinus albus]